ncbi:hypothetical protein PNA2_0851 [Pyrococcus sp. NA2]|uniref:hypothetical protein n=1 Tax=Pyrococcus sp. (strain NA2) TaxID=342949 RepID=UPI000209AF7D|nr:hypothetical protein [Pyrococcus sp. NA2]AEC51767.1 hypothetical protein PNA2_0851 [Pyrococcus sp. NA2]
MGLKDAIRYPTILFGLFLLIISLVLALVSMEARLEHEELRGTLSPGSHMIYSDKIVAIVDCNLTLYSLNANVSIYSAGKYYSLELSNNTVVLSDIKGYPRIETDGEVIYTLSVVGYAYPYSWLSPIGFVTMIAGSMLSLLGFASYLQGEMEKVKKKRKKEIRGERNVQGPPWGKDRF